MIIVGAALGGLLVGRSRREHHHGLRESSGVIQGALLGFMGLVLAFGLSLALGRYEDRRAAVVDDANTIGTTYLRAQTLSEPMRSQSLSLLVEVHRRRTGPHRRGAGQRCRRPDDRPGIGSAESALGACGAGRHEGADSECPPAVRGQPQRDDRPTDGTRRGTQQPRADRGAPARGDRRGRCHVPGRAPRGSPRSQPDPAPAGSRTGHIPALRHLRPRSPNPWFHPRFPTLPWPRCGRP